MPRGERYAWEFERGAQSLVVDGVLTLDRMALAIEAAMGGLGVAYVLEDAVRRQLARGELRVLLKDWCPADERYMLHDPGRRNVLQQLRAFIAFLRADPSARAESRAIGAGSPPSSPARLSATETST